MEGVGYGQVRVNALKNRVLIADSIAGFCMRGRLEGKRETSVYNDSMTLTAFERRMEAVGKRYMDEITSSDIQDDLLEYQETPSPLTGRPRTEQTIRTGAVRLKCWMGDAYLRREIDYERLRDCIIPRADKASVYMATDAELALIPKNHRRLLRCHNT